MASFASRTGTLSPPESYDLPTCNPTPLQPLETPPKAPLPQWPSPTRESLLDKWYTLSTHIVPAAYPRTTSFVPLPDLPKWSPNKDEFKASVRKTVRDLLDIKERQYGKEPDHLLRNHRPMWICVNRYVRKDLRPGKTKTGGVTLFLSHANGFPKEIWEPTVERLVSKYSSRATYTVDEIWSWEAANHGDSCLINKDSLGALYDWRDNSRDILHFFLHYLPSTVSPDALPTHLSRIPDGGAASRKLHGLQGRKLVSIGHSFGAGTLVRSAIEQPTLFRSLFLVEAMIRPRHPLAPRSAAPIQSLVTGAVQRRDGWSSREEAHKIFSSTPFFQAWDPAALDVFVQCALYDAPDGRVMLKMPGIYEAASFTEEYATHETFELLEGLDERVETRWLVAGKLDPVSVEYRRLVAWRRPANSSHVVIESSGHLIPQEAPSEVARELHEYIDKRYGAQKALL